MIINDISSALFILGLRKWDEVWLKEQSASDAGAALIVSGRQIPFLAKINKALIFLALFLSRKKE